MTRWNPPPFSCRVEPDGSRPHVLVEGELDLASVGELDSTLRALRDGGVEGLVLDLRGVTFMDSTGVSLVMRWSAASGAPSWDLRVRLGTAAEDVFTLCGVLPRLQVYDGDGAVSG